MPDTNDTDAILAKVRSGELSAGDAAALIANLHAASYKAMQDAQTAQAPQPSLPHLKPPASRACPSRAPVGGCRTLLSAAGSGYAGICRTDARCGCREGARDGSAAPSGTYSEAPCSL